VISYLGKAGTLLELKNRVKTAQIPPFLTCTFEDWASSSDKFIKVVNETLGSKVLIIRSSAKNEDTDLYSNAGKYVTVKNVSLSNLEDAINKVFDSYKPPIATDQVIVQVQLVNTISSGVVFTHDQKSGASYQTFNWHTGVDTSYVTGGLGGMTWRRYAGAENKAADYPSDLASVIPLVDELNALAGGVPLDIEFAITRNSKGLDTCWLLQVRPLNVSSSQLTTANLLSHLIEIEELIKVFSKKQPFVLGDSMILGVMPDWNPAEMIGIQPKPLALSIYRDLITDSTWAYQRHNYGYRNLRGFPLMKDFYGLPYIDVRLSFNSFVPADLDESLALRLVNHYMSQLSTQPWLHDKVEFEIVHSCLTFNTKNRLSQLSPKIFSKHENTLIFESLRRLTNRMLEPVEAPWIMDRKRLDTLVARHATIMESTTDKVSLIYWLLEDTRRYGTLPFAGLARAGFIASQMIKSLVDIDVFDQESEAAFYTSLSTVGGQLANAMRSENIDNVLKKYGHLRPGTYEITNLRYDEAPELYFKKLKNDISLPKTLNFEFSKNTNREVSSLLKKFGLAASFASFINFAQSAIELREYAKFCFTKNVSDALSLIAEMGESLGISREDMSYCNIGTIFDLYASPGGMKEKILQSINNGKAQYEISSAVALPPLITRASDVWSFHYPRVKPNFVGSGRVTALVEKIPTTNSLQGKIVLIENADPGYDWLFTHDIAGLITAWGGANSHMAIRCAELGIPAVIGIGQNDYEQYCSAGQVLMDCSSHLIEILP
jgi:hypothetical protein